MNNPQEDNQLMKAILSGNRMAFELLYERYFDRITAFANGFLHDKNLAEDITQEVFMVVVKTPEKFDLNKTFSTWIFTLTANKCRNVLRDKKTRNRILNAYNEDEAFHTDYSFDIQPMMNQIGKIIETLTIKDQQLYQLRFVSEMSVKDIATVMEIPEGSVKSGLYYLLKKLAKNLKQQNYEY